GHEPEIDVDKPEPRLAEHARPPAETTQRKAKRGSTESRRWIRAENVLRGEQVLECPGFVVATRRDAVVFQIEQELVEINLNNR
ncbi:hypothetical protein, partial [Microbacterium sp. LB12]|uniref:hypothetical protein n=1 Tax=Microbacterium sp. LB12 TaxID=3081270 RepID=UPI00301A0298